MRLFIILICWIFTFSANANIIDSIKEFFLTSTYEESLEQNEIFPLSRSGEDQPIFIFSPKKHLWAVYNTKGKRVGLGKANGGKDYCDDTQGECRTVIGKFKIFRKENESCTSKTFPLNEGGGAPMPYCMFFHKGYAIHGAKHVTDTNKSHGCIHVSQKAAEWMNTHYLQEGSYVLVLPYS